MCAPRSAMPSRRRALVLAAALLAGSIGSALLADPAGAAEPDDPPPPNKPCYRWPLFDRVTPRPCHDTPQPPHPDSREPVPCFLELASPGSPTGSQLECRVDKMDGSYVGVKP
ncbi:MAG: hypothetical protein JWM05_2598 [Acidimicrobiales bacterium]|nr:hypothetical protein [Acidimicrobiales bacterium]